MCNSLFILFVLCLLKHNVFNMKHPIFNFLSPFISRVFEAIVRPVLELIGVTKHDSGSWYFGLGILGNGVLGEFVFDRHRLKLFVLTKKKAFIYFCLKKGYIKY